MHERATGETLEELLSRRVSEMRLIGAEGDADDDEMSEDDDTEDKAGDDAEGDEDGDGEGSGDDEQDVEALKRKIKNLEEERGRNLRKRKEAQDEAEKAKAELAELKKNGVSDESLKTQNTELVASNKGLTDRVADLALENAFLKDNTYAWRDPEAALKLADLSQIEIDSDGSVHGLGAALEVLAKDRPFLLATDEVDPKVPPKKTGTKTSSKAGTQQANKVSEATRKLEYQSRYPGLRR